MTLEIRGLTKTYPNGVRALNGIDLSIGKGLFGLLGPNGAGKSSLMRTLATLQLPDSGSITFGEIDVLARPTRSAACWATCRRSSDSIPTSRPRSRSITSPR